MSDSESVDFLMENRGYEDEQEYLSNRSRGNSESQINEHGDSLNIRRQESGTSQSGAKPKISIDLRSKLRRKDQVEPQIQETHVIPNNHIYQPPSMPEPMMEHNFMPPSQEPQIVVPSVDPMKVLKNQYPTRYFIFKNLKPNHMRLCRDHNIAIISKAHESKLKFSYSSCDDLFIIFSTTETRQFQGFARMETDYFEADEGFEQLLKQLHLTKKEIDESFLFRIEWRSKTLLSYDYVQNIKNKWNDSKEVNQSKSCQDVDPEAGKKLMDLIENPPSEPPMIASDKMKKSDDLSSTTQGTPNTPQFPPVINAPGGMMPPYMNMLNPMGHMNHQMNPIFPFDHSKGMMMPHGMGGMNGMPGMPGMGGMNGMPGMGGMNGMPGMPPYPYPMFKPHMGWPMDFGVSHLNPADKGQKRIQKKETSSSNSKSKSSSSKSSNRSKSSSSKASNQEKKPERSRSRSRSKSKQRNRDHKKKDSRHRSKERGRERSTKPYRGREARRKERSRSKNNRKNFRDNGKKRYNNKESRSPSPVRGDRRERFEKNDKYTNKHKKYDSPTKGNPRKDVNVSEEEPQQSPRGSEHVDNRMEVEEDYDILEEQQHNEGSPTKMEENHDLDKSFLDEEKKENGDEIDEIREDSVMRENSDKELDSDRDSENGNEDKRKKMDEIKNSYSKKESANKSRSRSRSKGKKSSTAKGDYKKDQSQRHKTNKSEPEPLVIMKQNKESKVVVGNTKRSVYSKPQQGNSSSGKSSRNDEEESTPKNYQSRSDRHRNSHDDDKTPNYNQDQDSSYGKAIDLRARLSQKKNANPGSITNRIIKRN
jgi:hypothetical protein